MANPYERFTKGLVEGTARRQISERLLLTHGARSGFPILTPYVVLETIFDPQIIDDAKIAYWQSDVGVSNIAYAKLLPRNSIIAQRVSEGTSSPADAPMFLLPIFADIALSCNPGEHVWVIFPHRETIKMDLGYWLSRIVGVSHVDDANHTHAPRTHDPSYTVGTKDLSDGNVKPVYEFRPGEVDVIDGERFTSAETLTLNSSDDQVYEKLMTDTDAGKLRHYEPVPRLRKRPGDVVLEGRNNAAVVLGRHRHGPVADYSVDAIHGKIPSIPTGDAQVDGAGSIDVVAGRGQTPETMGQVVDNSLHFKEIGKSSGELVEREGDPDFANDRSRVLVAQRIQVDSDFGLTQINLEMGNGTFQGSIGPTNDVTDSIDGDGAAVIKSDKVRIIARSDIELIVSSYELDNEGKMVELTDPAKCAAIVLKCNGDIVLRPAMTGYIKLGGDNADKAIVCTDFPATATEGKVDADPIQTTMGGFFGGTKIPGQGVYASKILVVGPTTPQKK